MSREMLLLLKNFEQPEAHHVLKVVYVLQCSVITLSQMLTDFRNFSILERRWNFQQHFYRAWLMLALCCNAPLWNAPLVITPLSTWNSLRRLILKSLRTVKFSLTSSCQVHCRLKDLINLLHVVLVRTFNFVMLVISSYGL